MRLQRLALHLLAMVKKGKKSKYHWMAGDWQCADCRDWQFAKNPVCRQCGGPKPAELRSRSPRRSGSRARSDNQWPGSPARDPPLMTPPPGPPPPGLSFVQNVEGRSRRERDHSKEMPRSPTRRSGRASGSLREQSTSPLRPRSPQGRFQRMVAERPVVDSRDRRILRHRRVKAEPSPSPSRSASPAPEMVSGQELPAHLAERMAERADLPEPELVVQATGKVMDALDLILVNPGTHMSTLLRLYRKIRLTVEAREEFERAQAV